MSTVHKRISWLLSRLPKCTESLQSQRSNKMVRISEICSSFPCFHGKTSAGKSDFCSHALDALSLSVGDVASGNYRCGAVIMVKLWIQDPTMLKINSINAINRKRNNYTMED